MSFLNYQGTLTPPTNIPINIYIKLPNCNLNDFETPIQVGNDTFPVKCILNEVGGLLQNDNKKFTIVFIWDNNYMEANGKSNIGKVYLKCTTTCEGCLNDIAGQMAHMGYGGCLQD
jgi:hypothetical protein